MAGAARAAPNSLYRSRMVSDDGRVDTPMNPIFATAQRYQAEVAREARAHYVSAEYHRHQDMLLGGLAAITTAALGAGVIAPLVRQVVEHKGLSDVLGWPLYLIVVLLAIAAPVLTALHTFLHHGLDAEKHTASEHNYKQLLTRFDTFLAINSDLASTTGTKDETRKEFEEIMREFRSVRERDNITLTARAYRSAEEKLRDERA
jgi:hypothetical protein